MTGSGSPCGACKFLRRKCIKGCVFAPYFCHEQGAAHFAAIHRVFGASNVSKLLTQLPVSGRYEAALTIAYEAQARLQDPIYGCISHIFALQQQVVSLQSQLASLKALSAQSVLNGPSCSNCPSSDHHRHNERLLSYTPSQDTLNWFQLSENSWINMTPFDQSINDTDDIMNFNFMEEHYVPDYHIKEEDVSFSSFQHGSSYSIDSLEMQISNHKEWCFQDNMGDLNSVAFGYNHL